MSLPSRAYGLKFVSHIVSELCRVLCGIGRHGDTTWGAMIRCRRGSGCQIFTLAKMEDQMGSISGTLAAPMRVWSLSACMKRLELAGCRIHAFRNSMSSKVEKSPPQCVLLPRDPKFSTGKITNARPDPILGDVGIQSENVR